MPAVLEHPASLLESAPETPAAFPAWFAERQRAAWQRFLETPTPTRGVSHVHMANPAFPGSTADLVIFADIGEDDVHF